MKEYSLRFAAVCVGLALSWGASATPPEEIVMEAYGDSLTAGFLSGTNISNQQDLKEVSSIVSDLAMYIITGNRDYLTPHHRRDIAWPAIYARNLAKDGTKVTLQNVAVSGAQTRELTDQLRRVRAQGKKTVAFFFMGHNDLCHSSSDPQEVASGFVADYQAGIAEWDKSRKDSTAYVLPVSRVDLVYQTLKDYTWYEGPKTKYTCNDSWEKLFPYCPKYYRLAKKGKLGAFLVPKIRAMNQSLRQAVFDWNKQSKNNNTYKFVEVPETLNIGPDFFAVDCYHLSEKGQQIFTREIEKETY